MRIAANDSANTDRARYWMEKAREEARADRDPGGHLNYALHFIVQSGYSLAAANTNDEEVALLTRKALILNGKLDMERARNEVGIGQHLAHLSSAVARATRLGQLLAPQLGDDEQFRAGLAAIGTSEEEIASLHEGDIGAFVSIAAGQFKTAESRI